MSSSNTGSVVAILLNSGNLVLRNRPDDDVAIDPLWQSFDHPTDTWLPGGKIK
ncbi:G-type lectin S-receptor-like serine/threonine-protein kinase, partial [Trifolium medium]|nr:G-type lectin S-receptor-like serine/threonine-protein kinase [Trifolium medium]